MGLSLEGLGGVSLAGHMERGVILRPSVFGWAGGTFAGLYPGGHAVVFGGIRVPLEAEDVGFEVRDCLYVLGRGVERGWLLRRPLAASSVVGQTLATGTGGLWVDGCRIPAGGDCLGRMNRPGYNGWCNAGGGPNRAVSDPVAAAGRWPSNIVLLHEPGCCRAGVKRVRGTNAPGKASQGVGDRGFGFGSKPTRSAPMPFYTDPEEYGVEEVAAWDCAPGCPVAVLDEQSGPSFSPKTYTRGTDSGNAHTYGQGMGEPAGKVSLNYGDAGGASRFFPQFGSIGELDAWVFRLLLGEFSS